MKDRNPIDEARSAAKYLALMKRKLSSDKSRCCVTFQFPTEAAPDAKCVGVAGSFNEWCAARHPMKRLANGDFSLEIELPACQEYQFRFVINGVRWENAWNADKYVWSPFGAATTL